MNLSTTEAEADLGHEYDGPELRPGTPQYEAGYAEYRAWAEPEPEAYGPQPPTPDEVRQARIAPDLEKEAGCDVNEYERAVLTMLHTTQAFREAENRADLRAAAEHAEPELEAGL